MAQVITEAVRTQTNLKNESAEYRARRDELRRAEIELMYQRERVADLRRRLPKGTPVQDYVFAEGPATLEGGDQPVRQVRLSELFTAADRAVVIYHFMFGKKQTEPCPMCTLLIDAWNGVTHHLAQNVDVAVVAAADPVPLRDHARAPVYHILDLTPQGRDDWYAELGYGIRVPESGR